MHVEETKYPEGWTGYRLPTEKELVVRNRPFTEAEPDFIQLRPNGSVGFRVCMSLEEARWLYDGLTKCFAMVEEHNERT